ncbi:HPr family phosphocarrier protein, partial [Mycobacterium tuberculosis]|nr:HPr family phosphocarrier protein [Mycobacterium tuberculosis]
AASPGTTIHVAAKGADAEAALDAIGKLVEAKFFEE